MTPPLRNSCIRTILILTGVHSPSTAKVELFKLAAEYPCRKVELPLHGSHSLPRPHYRSLFSDDLAFLLLNDVIYSLNPSIHSIAPIHLPVPGNDVETKSSEGFSSNDTRSHYLAEFSPCNGFLLCYDTGSAAGQRSPKVELYQIMNEGCDTAHRMTFQGDLDLSKNNLALAKWHHIQPILSLIAWELKPADDAEQVIETMACYTLDLTHPHFHWVQAEKTISGQVSCM